MPIIEVIPDAKFGTLTVKGREGSFNGETTWRCKDEKGRNVVYLESEIMAMYVAPVEVVPDVEPETDAEDAKDEVPGGAAVAQTEPEQEKEEVKEEKPEPVVEKKKSFFSKNKKKKR